MAQSYGNSSFTPITPAVDSIVGVTIDTQLYGTSISGVAPASTLAASTTLTIEIDNDGAAQTVTFPAEHNIYDIAAFIQATVNSWVPGGTAPLKAFTGFTAVYNPAADQLVLTSGTAGSSTSRVQVTGGTAATSLLLGTANGGSESTSASPSITYYVHYQFVYGAGTNFGVGDVVVLSSEISTPTSLSQVEAVANGRAASIKAAQAPTSYTVETTSAAINGPVTLV